MLPRHKLLIPIRCGEVDSVIDEIRKSNGAYFTPTEIARALVRWAVRAPADSMLDPACGDGRFLSLHENSVGIEKDPDSCRIASNHAPHASIQNGDFFAWARQTSDRFDCAVGNPPFIRYQRFSGAVRERALHLCGQLGADFTRLTSSWAPFLVAAASLLRPGGRIAFVVPAEIGHAPYAIPLLNYLKQHFHRVHVIAIREKLFPDLSEDCWLLYADGYGNSTPNIRFTVRERFRPWRVPPRANVVIGESEWKRWKYRLRPFILADSCRNLYLDLMGEPSTARLGDVASVGIGYVTGANSFFHLRPSVARSYRIPDSFLQPTVRNGRNLDGQAITHSTVKCWMDRDKPVLLLRIEKDERIPQSVKRYLNSEPAYNASQSYKCRNRNPWYSVPDVTAPDAFLAYMSGNGPSLVANFARCSCTNSVHAVHLNGRMGILEIQRRWRDPLTSLSCELEGHPLGGGMLKVEPREAARILLAGRERSLIQDSAIQQGIAELKRWRHYV